MRRLSFGSLLATAVLASALAAPARADDLTVSTATSTPVATATAANNTPGNITVGSAGTIVVTTGAAATINSSNMITNGGTISSSATSNGIGVLFGAPGPISASLSNTGVIGVTGSGGTGNIGISLIGGPITGAITASSTSSVTVTGDNSFGVLLAAPFTGNISLNAVGVTGVGSTAVSIAAPLTGNLRLTGTSVSRGAAGYGLLIAAPVSGSVSNGGSISAGGARTFDTKNNPVAGAVSIAGVRAAASVGGGFVNDRYYVDSTGMVLPPTATIDPTKDTLITGSIAGTGNAPALWIAPDAANPQPITLGAVGMGDDAFGAINRGNISVSVATTRVAATAVQIGGSGAATNLVGGFNSQGNAAISATSLDASATAIDVGSGASVPLLKNQGVVAALATQTAAAGTTPQGAGGAAYGIVAEAGSSVPLVANSGTMTITATGAGNSAYGILDRSNTVTSIVNTGVITTTAATDATTFNRAIDVSANTGPVTVANSGAITGDIVFGNGPSTLQLSGGTIVGTVAFGTGANTLALSSGAVFNTALTSGSPMAVTLTDMSRLDLTKAPTTLGSLAASGSATLVVPARSGATPALTVNGAASFTQNSVIQLSLQSLAVNQNFTIIQANGGITTDHLGTLVNGGTTPYLFTQSTPTLTANTLSVSLTRKTSDQIGLTGPLATLFNASLTGLPDGSLESSLIANLPSQAAVTAAYAQILSPSAGRAQLRAAQDFADNGFGAAQQRLDVVDELRSRGNKGLGAWVQEFGTFSAQDVGKNETAFRNNGFGLAGGLDTSVRGVTAGAALVSEFITSRRYTGVGLTNHNVNSSTVGIAPYASWSHKALFVQATGLFAHSDYKDSRTIAIGTVTDPVISNWSSEEFGGGVSVGARLHLGRFLVTPSNAISWIQLDQNAYTEQGGGAFALKVRKQKDSVATDTARLALAWLHPLGDGTVEVQAHGSYAQQFQADATKTVAQYVTGGDWVPLYGDAPSKTKFDYGAALGYLQEAVSLKFDFDRAENSSYHDNSFAFTAGIAF